jgi:hypothetical protein
MTAGTGQEPSVTNASMIRNTMMNPPFAWSWNRFEDSSVITTIGGQDYVLPLVNFGWLEKVSLTDAQGKIWEIKDIYNTNALSKSTVQQRPSSIAVIANNPGTDIKIRLLGVPEQAYTVNLTYQGLAVQFGPFVINSSMNAVGGNTAYNGIFSPTSFPVGSVATITGFSQTSVISPVSSAAVAVGGQTTYSGVFNTASFPTGGPAIIAGFTKPGNNGTFVIVSVTNSTLVVANALGLTETAPATAIGIISSMNNGDFLVVSVTNSILVVANPNGVAEIPPPFIATAVNGSWAPIPDSFSDIYNNLFLAESFQDASEDAEAARYRQRGVAALLAKAEGLTQTQIDIFRQQSLARDSEQQASQLRTAQGSQARGI